MFLCVLLLIGCADPKILERVSLAVLIGYDVKDGKITTNVALRTVNQELQSVVSIASETEETSKGTRIKASLDSSKKIVAGQLRVVLLGDKLAENGVNQALHTLMMNSEISSSVYVAITEGSTKGIVDADYEQITDIGQHIYYLLDHNVQEQYTISSTLHETIRDNYSSFSDMSLPMLVKDEDDVHISGVALFNDDKMVGKIADKDVFYVVLIRDKYKAGATQITLSSEPFKTSKTKLPDEPPMAIDSIRSLSKIRLVDEKTPEFDLNIKFEARLLEIHSDIDTEDDSVMTKLEQEMTKVFKKDIERIIKQTQEVNSDIFGFGETYRATLGTTKVNEKVWKELYPKMKVNINIEFELLRNGVFE